MPTTNLLKYLRLIIFSLGVFVSNSVSAYYYAYITDHANEEVSKYLHVVNTDLGLLVQSIPLFGTPREIELSHNGEHVYVSTEVIDGNVNASKINIIDTRTNEVLLDRVISVQKTSVWGMTLNKADNIFYATHEEGITRIVDPVLVDPDQIELRHLDVTYSGASLTLSDDENYLFVTGQDGDNNYGISVVDVSQPTMTVILDKLVGPSAGSIDIEFENAGTRKSVYVVNRATSQLIRYDIENYDSSIDFDLVQGQVKSFPDFSYPVDMEFSPDGSEIFVSLSYIINSNQGDGDNGYIQVLDSTTLTEIADVTLSLENGQFSPDVGALHPQAINFDDSGKMHVIKQLWNEYAGTYVSSIDDRVNRFTGDRSFTESFALHLGKRSANQTIGRFIGPDCNECPTGLEETTDPVIRPTAINLFMLLSSFLFLLLFRYKK